MLRSTCGTMLGAQITSFTILSMMRMPTSGLILWLIGMSLLGGPLKHMFESTSEQGSSGDVCKQPCMLVMPAALANPTFDSSLL